MIAYGLSKGLSHEDALDFTQDVFLKLHRNVHLYEKGRPALPWFFTIVHRVLIDHIRRINNKNSKHVEFHPDQHAAATSQTQEARNEKELDQLRSLPKEQRSVVEMRALQGLSFKEISALTGKSEVASRKVFERALKALRKISGKGD